MLGTMYVKPTLLLGPPVRLIGRRLGGIGLYAHVRLEGSILSFLLDLLCSQEHVIATYISARRIYSSAFCLELQY